MKRVCHLTNVHPRYDTRIFFKECVSLASAGYDVVLVVNDELDDEIINGVKILSAHYSAKNRLDRILNGTKAVYKKALEVDADIYHFHDPELLPMGLKLQKANKKVIFDIHEDTERVILDKTWIPKPFLYLVSFCYKYYSAIVMKKLDALVTVTLQYVDKFKVYNNNIIMVTNYPILEECKDDSIGKNRVSEKYVCFAGDISEQWMHNRIIMAVDKIDNIKYVLAGKGTEGYLKQLKSLAGWRKVEYVGRIPHQEIKRFYAGALAGMAINHCSQLLNMGTLGNTKLFEYMEAQLPVVCTDYPLWKDVVEGNQCGICVNPEDNNAIREAIVYLKEHPEEAAQMGKNGRKAVREKYNWAIEEKKLLEFYQKLLN